MASVDHITKLEALLKVYDWKILKYKDEKNYTLASPGIDVTLRCENKAYEYRIFGMSHEMPPIVERMVIEIEAI